MEDIPGLAFLSLSPGAPTTLARNASPDHPGKGDHHHQQQGVGLPHSSIPWFRGRTPCLKEGIGDAWGGGVGGGWGAGLGLWRGLRGSLVGAKELLGHLKAYLGFYFREEAAMFAPLVEVRKTLFYFLSLVGLRLVFCYTIASPIKEYSIRCSFVLYLDFV